MANGLHLRPRCEAQQRSGSASRSSRATCLLGVDPVPLEGAEGVIEAALFDLVTDFQSFYHLPERRGIFDVHVERGRIDGTDPAKSSLVAPCPFSKRLWMEPKAERIRARRGGARGEGECEKRQYSIAFSA